MNTIYVLAHGSSKNPCSAIFAGPKPFSSPESFALSEFVKSFDNLKMYLSFHSYGQLLLFPYVSIERTNVLFVKQIIEYFFH